MGKPRKKTRVNLLKRGELGGETEEDRAKNQSGGVARQEKNPVAQLRLRRKPTGRGKKGRRVEQRRGK